MGVSFYPTGLQEVKGDSADRAPETQGSDGLRSAASRLRPVLRHHSPQRHLRVEERVPEIAGGANPNHSVLFQSFRPQQRHNRLHLQGSAAADAGFFTVRVHRGTARRILFRIAQLQPSPPGTLSHNLCQLSCYPLSREDSFDLTSGVPSL